MIRSFKDKIKKKQEAYEAKQKILAAEAKQARIKHEWELFDLEQEKIKQRTQQILIKENSRQHTEYLQWKENQKLLAEQEAEAPVQNNSGVGMNHASTWQLTWKSFSTRPEIIDLPMSQKIRLYKIAEQQQIERLNYYANLHAPQNVLGNQPSARPWEDGIIDISDQYTVVSEDTEWTNSVEVRTPISVNANITLTVNGILTVLSPILNRGHIIVEGLVIGEGNIQNIDSGTLTILD